MKQQLSCCLCIVVINYSLVTATMSMMSYIALRTCRFCREQCAQFQSGAQMYTRRMQAQLSMLIKEYQLMC